MSRSDLVIVGAGVAGCALAASLRLRGWCGSITLFEIGRGEGGRAATRRSRLDPDRRINHGAPLFNVEHPLPLLQALQDGGWIEPYTGAIASLDASGSLGPPFADPLLTGELWQGAGGCMEQLCIGLLQLARQHPGPLTLLTNTLVRHIEPIAGLQWRLRGREGKVLHHSPWLVLSGTLLAHPRCQQLLGWDAVPLQQAATRLHDPQLDQTAVHLAAIEAMPSLNLLMRLTPEQAQPWLAQPWRLLQLEPRAQQRWPLRRISIQPRPDGSCAVVAESSAALAQSHGAVVGSGSSAATTLAMQQDSEQHEAALQTLHDALEQTLHLEISGHQQLMRWSAAFPLAPGVPAEHMLCLNSQIGFCGDAIAGVGFGRVEGALRSADALAEQLMGEALS